MAPARAPRLPPELTYGSLDRADARAARELVDEALVGLEPYLTIRRDPDEAVAMLSGQVDRFRNMFDLEAGTEPAARLEAKWGKPLAVLQAERAQQELTKGFHGTGEHAGKTVFATLAFRDPRGDEPSAAPNRAGTDVGYGGVAFELAPHALERATVLPADQGLIADAHVQPVSRLTDVVLGRLTRDHGYVVDEPRWFDQAALGRPKQDLVDTIRAPRSEAVRRLREQILGWGDSAAGFHYIEAQLPASVADVRAVRVEGQTELAARIADLAAKRALPVVATA